MYKNELLFFSEKQKVNKGYKYFMIQKGSNNR